VRPKSRILGIDPGVSVTGYGIIDFVNNHPRLVECGTIKTKARQSSGEKYWQLCQGVRKLIRKRNPGVLAVEDSFVGKNFRSAKALGGAKAVVLLAGAEKGIVSCEFSPREIKQAIVGRGEASKQQVNFMVGKLLSLKSNPDQDDISDALAVALCCSFKAKGVEVTKR
jgi:crossover junction endodeoxyribonuclease RuvC